MGDFEKLIKAAERGAVEDVAAVLDGHPEFINQRDATGAMEWK